MGAAACFACFACLAFFGGRAGMGPVPGQEIVHLPVPDSVAAGSVGTGPVPDGPCAATGAVGPSANLAVRPGAAPGRPVSRTSPVHLIPSHHRSTVGEPGAGYQPGGCEPDMAARYSACGSSGAAFGTKHRPRSARHGESQQSL